MKRLYILFFVIFSAFSIQSKADHIIGGEIGWRCLSNGLYQFHMTVYRDCSTSPYTYQNEDLMVSGFPLPENGTGQSISMITLLPDTVKWKKENNGDISPKCSNTAFAVSCADQDPEAVQAFYYSSNPFTMSGTPPQTGWTFEWESPCCRPDSSLIVNISSGLSNMHLRAIMFPTKDALNVNPCIDSSPEYLASPNTYGCRNSLLTYNPTVFDPDLDSLVYSWDRPYNGPLNPVTYSSGYTSVNPTPDQSFDSRNTPSTLNSQTGFIKRAIYSGNGDRSFILALKVDAYREGSLIASVSRESLFTISDCPLLPNGSNNSPPRIAFDGITADSLFKEVTAGQKINISVQVDDLDSINAMPPQQELSLIPMGLLYNRDFNQFSPCELNFVRGTTTNLEPCAYLKNPSPFLDTNSNPPSYKIEGLSSIATEFEWQTDCNHLVGDGIPGEREGMFNFVFKVMDNYCPLPGTVYPTLTVKINDPKPLTAPIMKGISVDLVGEITYQWVPPIDSVFTFENYIVEETKTIDGQPPIAWNNLNNNLKDFQQEKKNVGYQIHRNVIPTDPTSPRNILQKIAHRDWYMRMRAVSGCTNDVVSKPSDPVRIIELDAIGINDSLGLGRDRVNLSWNAPKTDSAMTYDYFYYESETRYYIWQSDSVYLAGLSDSSNWYLRESTYSTSKEISSNSCNDYAAFRIEARDTVITWKRGNAPSSSLDSLDTLTFSTYSVIDTLFLNYAKPTVQRIGTQVLNSDYPADTYQWIDCNADSLLTNENSRELQLSDTGRYAVITSNGSCMDTSDCFTVKADLNNSIVKMGRKTLLSLDSLANYQWFDCEDNSLIQGANNRTYQATDTGRFGVIVSVFNFSERSNCLEISLNLNDSIVLIGKDTLQSLDTLASYQWYNCGKASIIAGATERSFVMKDTGYYAVIVSDFGYSDTSNCYPYFPIGLPKQSFQEGIVVYPNPTNEKLNIRLNKNYKNVQLRVISIHGQVVQEKQINQQQLIELNLTGEPGIYFVQLSNQAGERANFKVVKQ